MQCFVLTFYVNSKKLFHKLDKISFNVSYKVTFYARLKYVDK